MTKSEIVDKLDALMQTREFSNALAMADSSADVLKLLAGYGVNLTEEELRDVMDAVHVGSDDELAEGALENVSGGVRIANVFARLRAIIYGGGGGGFSSGGGGQGAFGGGGR